MVELCRILQLFVNAQKKLVVRNARCCTSKVEDWSCSVWLMPCVHAYRVHIIHRMQRTTYEYCCGAFLYCPPSYYMYNQCDLFLWMLREGLNYLELGDDPIQNYRVTTHIDLELCPMRAASTGTTAVVNTDQFAIVFWFQRSFSLLPQNFAPL